MNTVLVVAPHADDETLGCGGTLLRHLLLTKALQDPKIQSLLKDLHL